MHFAGHPTPPGTGIFRLPAFHCWKRVQCACRWKAGVRHWMDGARAGFFSITDGQSHRLPCGGYCGLLYPATLFRNPDCGVQDRVRTACILNLLLSAVRRTRQVLGISLRSLIPTRRALIHVAALLGSTAVGVMVEVTGYSGNSAGGRAGVFLLVKAGSEFPQCCRQSQPIWSYMEKSSQETG
jgi:hypothetical protein